MNKLNLLGAIYADSNKIVISDASLTVSQGTAPSVSVSNDNGVMTRPVWEMINRLPMFQNCETAGLTNTAWLADRIVNIPSSPKL